MFKKFINNILPTSPKTKKSRTNDEDDINLPWDEIGFSVPASFTPLPKNEASMNLIMLALEKHMLFSSYEKKDLRVIATAFEGLEIPANNIIMKEGSKPYYFYLLQSGKLSFLANETSTSKRIQVDALSDSGSCFGERAFLTQSKRSATIVTQENSVLWRIDGPTFISVITRKISMGEIEKSTELYNVRLHIKRIRDVLIIPVFNEFIRYLTRKDYCKGDTIAAAGNSSDVAYIIRSGSVRIQQSPLTESTVSPSPIAYPSNQTLLSSGETIGINFMVNGCNYELNYVADSDLVGVYEITRDIYTQYFINTEVNDTRAQNFQMSTNPLQYLSSSPVHRNSMPLPEDNFNNLSNDDNLTFEQLHSPSLLLRSLKILGGNFSGQTSPKQRSNSSSPHRNSFFKSLVSSHNSNSLPIPESTFAIADNPTFPGGSAHSSSEKSNQQLVHHVMFKDNIEEAIRDITTLIISENSARSEEKCIHLQQADRFSANSDKVSPEHSFCSPVSNRSGLSVDTDHTSRNLSDKAISVKSDNSSAILSNKSSGKSEMPTGGTKPKLNKNRSSQPPQSETSSATKSSFGIAIQKLNLNSSSFESTINSQHQSLHGVQSVNSLDSEYTAEGSSTNYNPSISGDNSYTARSNMSTSRGWMNTARSFDPTEYPILSARSKQFLESSKIESNRIRKVSEHRKSIQAPFQTSRFHLLNSPKTPSTPKRLNIYQNLKLEDCELIKILGIGGFGKVRLARIKETNQLIVLKTQSKKAILAASMEAVIINEIQLQRELNNPFIARLYCSFQDKRYIHMAMELLQGGDFFAYLKREVKFPEHKAVFYSSMIVLALEAMHSVKIAYRDLKPENIVFNRMGYVKLIDFGLAKRVKGGGKLWTMCGTPDYMAPEIVNNRGHGCEVDWWAVGALVYEMIDGYPPFYHENPFKIYQKILHSDLKFRPNVFSIELTDIITKLMVKDSTRRLGYSTSDGITAIQTHPWFATINWKYLFKGKLKPPYTPELKDPLDTSFFEEYHEEPEPNDLEVDWEANLDLTLMERRRAELSQLSQAWANVRAQKLAEVEGDHDVDVDSLSLNTPFTPARYHTKSFHHSNGSEYMEDLIVDDIVLAKSTNSINILSHNFPTPRGTALATAPSVSNEIVQQMLTDSPRECTASTSTSVASSPRPNSLHQSNTSQLSSLTAITTTSAGSKMSISVPTCHLSVLNQPKPTSKSFLFSDNEDCYIDTDHLDDFTAPSSVLFPNTKSSYVSTSIAPSPMAINDATGSGNLNQMHASNGSAKSTTTKRAIRRRWSTSMDIEQVTQLTDMLKKMKDNRNDV